MLNWQYLRSCMTTRFTFRGIATIQLLLLCFNFAVQKLSKQKLLLCVISFHNQLSIHSLSWVQLNPYTGDSFWTQTMLHFRSLALNLEQYWDQSTLQCQLAGAPDTYSYHSCGKIRARCACPQAEADGWWYWILQCLGSGRDYLRENRIPCVYMCPGIGNR